MNDIFENPMGLQGFEFVEFASPVPNLLEPFFEKLGFTQAWKAAVVYSDSGGQAADFKFLETVCVNRGYNLRTFTNIDLATQWLQG